MAQFFSGLAIGSVSGGFLGVLVLCLLQISHKK